MKKLLLILFCLPFIGVGQEKYNTRSLVHNTIVIDTSLVKLRDLGPAPLLLDSFINYEDDVSKSSIMNFPYPVIFIHGLKGFGESWLGCYINLFNRGWTNGGFLKFCLNMYDISYVADYCNLTTDVNSFIPSNLQSADYYKIEFDCQTNGVCHTSNSHYIESNQSAIIKQGYALGIAIDKVLNATGKEKVILIGHSMGGLAAREYIQNSVHWKTNSHRVAKLITSGTPHMGSDLTGVFFGGFLGYEERSEAVRDLRDYYQFSMQDGAYLYANNIYETDAWIRNSLLWNYRNVDVNCNGQEGDPLNVGLNDRIAPQDLDYACIYGTDDIVVTSYSSNLKNWYSYLSLLELFTCDGCSHSNLPENTNESFYETFKALDEPEYFSLAYKLDFGVPYKGYSTYQDPNHPNISWNRDVDSYYFILDQSSNIYITVSSLNSNGKIELFSDDVNYTLQAASNANISGFASIQINLSPGKYYLDITADSYGNPINGIPSPWDNPYNFIINSSIVSEMSDISNQSKRLNRITDLLGQVVLPSSNKPLLFIYDDGTVEKKIIIK